jgi:hypothetical protein
MNYTTKEEVTSIEITLIDNKGFEDTKMVSFAEGFPTCRPVPGEDIIARPQDVMALAAGKVERIKDARFYSKDAKLATMYDREIPMSQEDALNFIVQLAQKESAMLKMS